MERTRAENRFNSRRKALRKRRIDRQTQGHYSTTPYYDNLHQYSKNKVHYSCPWCSPKSKDCPKHSDLKKAEFAKNVLKEYEDESYEEIQEPS